MKVRPYSQVSHSYGQGRSVYAEARELEDRIAENVAKLLG